MANRVTIQDIADALGISRNTVSKAINNTGVLADATREKILKKAAEMGYKQFSYFTAADLNKTELFTSGSPKSGEIALFTTVFWGKSYFISTICGYFSKGTGPLRLQSYHTPHPGPGNRRPEASLFL